MCNNSALKSYNLNVHGVKVFSKAVLPSSLNPALNCGRADAGNQTSYQAIAFPQWRLKLFIL